MVLPTTQDRDLVVFKVWKSLPYNRRLGLSFALIGAGLLIQFFTLTPMPGVWLLLAGNVFLLVTGYNNCVDLGRYDPSSQWEKVPQEKLRAFKDMDRRIRSWDMSALDVSNAAGLVVFLLVAGPLGAAAFTQTGAVQILAVDGLALLTPHWITGIRRILRLPSLIIKVETVQDVVASLGPQQLGKHEIQYLMLLQGSETQMPADLKFKVNIEGRSKDFLGLYGQVVLNDVQGTSYPYFYVVLVAKKGFGLHKVYKAHRPGANITKEFKNQDGVEVLILRQTTTKKSGYHTDAASARRILSQGLRLAEQHAN